MSRSMRWCAQAPRSRRLKNNPRVVYRYLGTYLARSLSQQSRRQILTTHYAEVIAGVKNKEQLSATLEAEAPVSFDYDAFWNTFVATEASAFYLLTVPIPDRPLQQIKPNHRHRTRLKRQFKNEVTEATKLNLIQRFLRRDSGRADPECADPLG
jgi:uncharacterized protein VirK/YbjX